MSVFNALQWWVPEQCLHAMFLLLPAVTFFVRQFALAGFCNKTFDLSYNIKLFLIRILYGN
jgi:hypothetical protein